MEVLDFSALFTLFMASAYDVLLPGHMTPLLIAFLLSGRGKVNVWRLCLGMALGHSIIMSGAIVAGMGVKTVLQSPMLGQFGLISRQVIYGLAAVCGVYFTYIAIRSWRHARSDEHTHTHMPSPGAHHPFFLGVAFGVVPCPATAGYAVIGMQMSMLLWQAIIAVVAGMMVSLSLIGLGVFYMPRLGRRLHKGLQGTPLYTLAAIVCFAYAVYGALQFHKDYPLTWHRMWAWVDPIASGEKELRRFYAVDIHDDDDADIAVHERDDGRYDVTFSFEYLGAQPRDLLPRLGCPAPFVIMSRDEYSTFLRTLREYLDTTTGASWHPAGVFMARHISMIHHVSIATNRPADILVSRTPSGVCVEVTNDVLDRAPANFLEMLGMSTTTTDVSRVEYDMFLSRLHASLSLTPLNQ